MDGLKVKNKWIIVDLINGERYAYRGEVSSEKQAADIIKVDTDTGSLMKFADLHPNAVGKVRLNEMNILFAWEPDAESELYKHLESFCGK
jgi:hypothetical protein